LNLNEWAFYSRVDRTVPQQENGFDCGMFIIMYVDSLVNNRSVDHLSFTQQQIPEYRLKLANAILRGSLNNNENNIVSDAIFI
jgi:Ulp1 family protease